MILQFVNEYAFLSNFYPCKFTYNGITYENSEAAFQAQKCSSYTDRITFSTLPPSAAKRLGRKVPLREDWEQVKEDVMYSIVLAKFTSDETLKSMLLDTGIEELVEGNTWGDTYWGYDLNHNTGENTLGKILMKFREVLSK